MERAELEGWLRLTLTPGVGNESARQLLAAFGLPDAIFGQSATALRQVVRPAQASALHSEPPELAALLDLTWRWLQAADAASTPRQIVVLGDADYPASLLAIDDPPLLLYLLGSGHLTATTDQARPDPAPGVAGLAHPLRNSIAMVGSENCDVVGLQQRQKFPHPCVEPFQCAGISCNIATVAI